MIVLALFLFGLALGSFVNAFVWRLHEQDNKQNAKGKNSADLSILKGRSMCPNCHHTLAIQDLVPVVSWLGLGGKCRYCAKVISWQYPLVELLTAVLFVGAYLWWPNPLVDFETTHFVFWLGVIVLFVSLAIYDLKWMTLPNKIIYPFLGASVAWLIVRTIATGDIGLVGQAITSLAITGGLFYVLFQLSNGRWIGGGDVKLGFVLGILLADPGKALLTLFIASLLGSLVTLPLLAMRRLKRTTRIPFGPFLILATVIAQLFGTAIIAWYSRLVIFT